MDQNRERLKEVHASDLTEGRVNQDFVDWLKTKGLTYLLIAMIALCGSLAYVRWSHHRTSYAAEAWSELNNAALPASLEEIAERYDDVGSVAELARLKAAQNLLISVQIGKALGVDAAERKDLTAEEREDYLRRADAMYEKVVAGDDQSAGKTLLVTTALSGRAAVAESRGQPEQARQYYEQAAARAATMYPELATQIRKRADATPEQATAVALPTQADLNAVPPATQPSLEQVSMDPWVRDLILPKDDDQAAADGEDFIIE